MRIVLSPLTKKQLSAFLMFAWCYISLPLLVLLVGMSTGLVLQEMGLVNAWGKRMPLSEALSIFTRLLLVAAGYTFLMWRRRRTIILMVRMIFYGAKSLVLLICNLVVNYREMVMYGNMSRNILIRENDIIYIPPTWLGGVSRFIEKILQPLGSAVQAMFGIAMIQASYDLLQGKDSNFFWY